MEGPGRKTLFEVLYAAAWVVGEYASLIPSVAKGAWKRASDNGVDLALGDEEVGQVYKKKRGFGDRYRGGGW